MVFHVSIKLQVPHDAQYDDEFLHQASILIHRASIAQCAAASPSSLALRRSVDAAISRGNEAENNQRDRRQADTSEADFFFLFRMAPQVKSALTPLALALARGVAHVASGAEIRGCEGGSHDPPSRN